MATTSPSDFGILLSGRVHLAGGIPTTFPDVPICAVLILAYLIGAAGNVGMYFRYDKQFLWQMPLFGYCMSRVTTLILRLAWSQRLKNSNLAIASLVFLNAGVLLIFLINLILCKKAIFRTHYTYFTRNPGKKQAVKKSFAGVCLLLLPLLAITITGAIQSFLATRASIQSIDTILKRLGVTAFLIYTCLPFPILAINALLRLTYGEYATVSADVDTFHGDKLWSTNSTVWKNSALILLSSSLVILEYSLKLVQGYANATVARWYFTKPAFYCLNILPELLAMYTLLLADMPKRYAGLARRSKQDKLEM